MLLSCNEGHPPPQSSSPVEGPSAPSVPAGSKPEAGDGLGARMKSTVDEAEENGDVIATVGNAKIGKPAFDELYSLAIAPDRDLAFPQRATPEFHRRSILERLTYHEVLRQVAERERLTYDEAELDRLFERRRREPSWATHLAKRGETEESLRATIIERDWEEALLVASGEVNVTRAEIEAYYAANEQRWRSNRQRYRASSILIAIDPAVGETAARRKADEIYAEAIKPGADFAALARKYSDGDTARRDGDVGIIRVGRVDDTFERAALALSVGEISKPFETKYGYNVIKLTGRWRKGLLPIEAVEDEITDRLRRDDIARARPDLKAELLASAEVLWFIDIQTGERIPSGYDPFPKAKAD